MYNNYISQDYLMHHGVKGMKWGVRHDPQPTGRMRRRAANQQYRQSVKAAGRRNIQAFRENYGSREARRSANQQFRNEVNAAKQKSKEAFALTDKQKKMAKRIAIGAAVVAGVGLATYGGYKISNIRINNQASVAKFLNKNPDFRKAIKNNGIYGNSTNSRKGGKVVGTAAKLKGGILGPNLSGYTDRRMTYNRKPTGTNTLNDLVGKHYYRSVSVGNKGDGIIAMTKEDRKKLAKQYRQIYSKYAY